MPLLITLQAAIRGLAASRLRMALTALGVIIGTASVISMLSLGNGARAAVDASFRSLGSDQIMINTRLREGRQGEPVGRPLTYQDGLGLMAQVTLVDRVEMSVKFVGRLRHGRTTFDQTISGNTADALASMVDAGQLQPAGWQAVDPPAAADFLSQGRYFTHEEVVAAEAVCVLGYETSLALFYGDDPINRIVRVNRQRCRVIGVFTQLETVDPESRLRDNSNDAFHLPIGAAVEMAYDEPPPVSITTRVVNEELLDQAREHIAHYLRQRHAIEPNADGLYLDDFEMTTKKDVLGAQQASARTFAVLLAAMATISLVVGGIGIMNVMLVSVTERTREIGVRLAVGATRRDVVTQFLLEAMMLSGSGGVIGSVAGVLSIPLAASLNGGVALLSPGSIPLAFGFSLLAGLLFGIYPAVRASRLDPIEALGRS